MQALMKVLAPSYRVRVEPLMIPLAENLAGQIPVETTPQRAVDLGTGTGALARALIGRGVRHVIGIDCSAPMLVQGLPWPGIDFVLADIAHLPLRSGSVDLAASHFGLNSTSPKRMLKLIRQALLPGGMLLLHEWGAVDPWTQAVIQASAALMEDRTIEPRITLPPSPWEEMLQTAEDYVDLLEAVGFTEITVHERQPVDIEVPLGAFVEYRLTFIEALLFAGDPVAEVQVALRHAIYQHIGQSPGTTIHWKPTVFQVKARRPA
jgi:SAM-dependent methyltransferase